MMMLITFAFCFPFQQTKVYLCSYVESFIAQVSGNIITFQVKLFQKNGKKTLKFLYLCYYYCQLKSNDMILNDCDDLLVAQLIQPNHQHQLFKYLKTIQRVPCLASM